jgi:hypothetical protein
VVADESGAGPTPDKGALGEQPAVRLARRGLPSGDHEGERHLRRATRHQPQRAPRQLVGQPNVVDTCDQPPLVRELDDQPPQRVQTSSARDPSPAGSASRVNTDAPGPLMDDNRASSSGPTSRHPLRTLRAPSPLKGIHQPASTTRRSAGPDFYSATNGAVWGQLPDGHLAAGTDEARACGLEGGQRPHRGRSGRDADWPLGAVFVACGVRRPRWRRPRSGDAGAATWAGTTCLRKSR